MHKLFWIVLVVTGSISSGVAIAAPLPHVSPFNLSGPVLLVRGGGMSRTEAGGMGGTAAGGMSGTAAGGMGTAAGGMGGTAASGMGTTAAGGMAWRETDGIRTEYTGSKPAHSCSGSQGWIFAPWKLFRAKSPCTDANGGRGQAN